MPGKTLYDKIWDAHVVSTDANGEAILYIDLHLIHEVTTPQAFAGLRAAHRGVRRPDRTLAVADHNVPTEGQALGVAAVADEEARLQLQTLERNVADAGIEFFPMGDPRNGIVHVVGPEQGRTQPGMTIVCGDSHTSTHGAFGALAQGIGTSEVEHVLATQTLRQTKSKNMRVSVRRRRRRRASAPRTIALALIGQIGTAGGTGYVIEYAGEAIAGALDGRADDALQPDHRGRRAGRPGRARRDHLRLSDGPARRAEGRRPGRWRCAYWKSFFSDPDARFDREVAIDVSALAPMVTWGTSPEDVVADRRPSCPIRPTSTRRKADAGPPRAGLHGPRARPADRRAPGSTGSSSAPAPTAASRTCAPPPRSREGADAGRGRAARDAPWWCRARAW